MVRRQLWLAIGLLFLYIPISSAKTHTITEAWVSLSETENQCPDVYDYFPNGGLLSFYCHAKTLMDLQDLQRMAKVPVFLSGPHKNNQPTTSAEQEFGHYNPKFVQWLIDNLIPAADNGELHALTQTFYEQYVQPLARTYYKSYQALQALPENFAAETRQYADLVEQRTLPVYYYDKFYDFADLHELGYEGNVVKGAVAFWIRRNIDGTIEQFVEGLEKLLGVYDDEFLTLTKPAPQPQSLIDIWLNLDTTFQQTDTRCEAEQTWLPDEGVRGFYCHIKSGLNFGQLQTLAQMPIFLSGPHQEQQLNLNARFSFGHYNPAFVEWLGDNFIPAKPEPAFLQTTQTFYSDYIQKLARTYYLIYRLLQLDPEFQQAEQQRYIGFIETQTLPEFYPTMTYFNMKSQYIDLEKYAGSDYEVATAMTFWLRRLMDGTADEFIIVLQKLLTTYDVSFLNQFPIVEVETEQTFSFKFNSHQADDFWVIDAIQVVDAKGKLVQTLKGFSAEQFGSAMEIYNLEQNDFNFDGYPDLRLPRILPTDNLLFFYWLYNPEQKQFVRYKPLEELSYLDFDPPSKTFTNHWIKNDQNYGEDIYHYTDASTIELIKQTIHKKVGSKTLITVLKRDAQGEMAVTMQNIE